MKTLAALLLLAMAADNGNLPKKTDEEQPNLLICDCQPQYPGGETALMQHLQKTVNYTGVTCNEVGGKCVKVVARFDIDSCGKVTNARIVKGDDTALNSAVIKTINTLPCFIPCQNQIGNVTFNLPMHITLQR